jgi:hypothetical protein
MAAGAGVILTELALSRDPNFASLILTLALSGIGFGVAVVPITTVALSALPAKHSGMAASATTTTREVGTVLGVAALGSLFNNKLTTYLTVKLTELKVPAALHEDIKNAVLTGKIPKLLPDLYTPVIENPTMDVVNQLFPAGVADLADERVIAEGIVNATNAALDAVGNGVSWSLWVAGAIIIISGVVAYFTFPRTS